MFTCLYYFNLLCTVTTYFIFHCTSVQCDCMLVLLPSIVHISCIGSLHVLGSHRNSRRPRSPSPAATDVPPLSQWPRRSHNWDIPPAGFEHMTVQQVKDSGALSCFLFGSLIFL
jgi:hypothetical protein